MENEILKKIRGVFERNILKNPKDFLVSDYNNFEKEIWSLKEDFNLSESPFDLLPDPAKDADYLMMNASMDGLVEPSIEAKEKYLKMMKESYEKIHR